MSSIEATQLESGEKWRTLPLNFEIAKTCSLAAVPFLDKIMVFGGTPLAPYKMYSFSLEGVLLEEEA